MRITPIRSFNSQEKLRTNGFRLRNENAGTTTVTDATKTNEVNFKGRGSKLFTVLGGAFGLCFGPVFAAAGAYLGYKYGKLVDEGSDEFKKSGFEREEDGDPNNFSGR